MKKIVVFFTGLLFFSTPVFAQKLGSSANPNPTGSAGAFAVYTPREIQEMDEAGHDTSLAVDPATSSRAPKVRRRPNYWVLSGGKLSAEEQEELFAEQDAFMQEEEEKKKIPVATSRSSKTGMNAQTESPSASGQAAGSSSVASRMQELATSTPSDTQASAAVGRGNENVRGAESTALENEADDSAEEDTLVCRKYEKCAICERQKPFWNGRECASARKIAKMKKRDQAQAAQAQNRNRNNNGARGDAASENSSANANNASAAQGQNVQGANTETQQQDPTLNPDGTKKSKKQLRRERKQARANAKSSSKGK